MADVGKVGLATPIIGIWSGLTRRDLIALVSAVAAWPVAARSSESVSPRRVAMLMGGASTMPVGKAMPQLSANGYDPLDGVITSLWSTSWWTGDAPDGYQRAAAELLSLSPDVIVASTTSSLKALHPETGTIPVVFTMVSDPVAQGFIDSFARPGRDITGFATFVFSIGSKWLGLLQEVDPNLAHVLFLHNPQTSPQMSLSLRSLESAAERVHVTIHPAPITSAAEIEPVIAAFGQEKDGGVIVSQDSFLLSHEDAILDSVARHKMLAIWELRDAATGGGLMSYDFDLNNNWRRAANYVDRILKGEKAGDLPVQLPEKYDLVINLKTAKALEITIPPTLLADEVIE